LPSCSSAPKPADKPQVKSECGEVKKIYDDFGVLLTELVSGSEKYRLTYITRAYYLLENPKCFTSVQIAAARAQIIYAGR
jgi:hypothetical protein